MSPMDHPSFCVPLVLSVELDDITLTKRGDPRGKIDVVGDQDCLARIKPNDESLVAAAFVVIREDFGDQSLALNLNVARVLFKGTGQNRIVSRDT